MAKIYEIMDAKREKQKETISFAHHLEKAKERFRKPPPHKPAEVMTIEQLRRMMGDTGARQFLKDKGNRRK
ncbi:hypothetical protein ACQCN2_01000 [Brevibacillus ginsengisoli]|uniref:hypothetical protein n=1 Tax=Brevibacillus ginsengisoli TaxID=363854 RepID=UPI003CEAA6C4